MKFSRSTLLTLSMLAGMASTLWGCGADDRFVMLGTARAPSTSGIIELDDVDGGNTLVTIHMEHLHPASRLEDGFSSYVVWFEGEGGTPIRVGELLYDPDNRTGDLAETSPLKKFVVKITAERDAHNSTPSDFVIATQEVEMD